ncbi:MAG: hypothetical protein KBA91_01810 [Candidatus Moranbacteria bacterium]|nr:hypothetical protein [Candidatus Moranbacteria bacterium]
MDQKIVDIVLTDIQLHIVKPRKPISPARAIEKSLRNGKSGRFYSKSVTPTPNEPGVFRFSVPLSKDMLNLKEKLEKEGKEVRFVLPPGGLNIYAGKDTIEFIEAQKKKRVDKKKI